MQYVKLVNRSSKTLEGVWDGRHYEITPGEHSFPAIQARKFKDQNPVMGSQNPYTLSQKYLIGIEEDGDDCSPIEQSGAIELGAWNRPDGVAVIKGNGLYNPHLDAPSNLTPAGSFEKP